LIKKEGEDEEKRGRVREKTHRLKGTQTRKTRSKKRNKKKRRG